MPQFHRRHAALAASLTLALAPAAFARDLGNYDINAAQRPKSAAVAGAPANVDAIGRATFTWVSQALDAQAKAAANDPVALARAHVRALLGPQAKVAGGDPADVLQDALAETQPGGAQLVRFTPRVGGVPIFHEDLALLMDREARLVAMRGPLPRESASQAKSMPAFALGAAEAVAVALGAHDFAPSVADQLQPVPQADDDYLWFRLPAQAKSASGAVSDQPQRARRVWFRTAAGLQPAWYVETQVADSPAASLDNYGFVVSALDGRVLFRIHQVSHAAFSYSAWADDAPDFVPLPNAKGRALSPDPDGVSTNNAAAVVAPSLRTLSSAPFSRAATDPWLPDGATVLTGNNVEAYADLASPNGFGAGDLRPTATGPSTFNFAFTPSLPPDANANQTSAATVHLFYTVNWLHDMWYDHGFTEVDGNAQADNYGRGGRAGDRLVAQAQDYDTDDNANMATPSDGFSPRMQMGLTTGNPVADFTLDGRTIAHEWGHYLSNRLVADATGLFTTHARGMGEGWSDVVGQILVVNEADRLKPGNANFEGAYGGGYVDSSYFGLRRYPYTTDMAKNPLTLIHIARSSSLPFGVSRNTQTSQDNAQVHNQGEIWASALWEGYAAMLRDTGRLSFREAQGRMMDYVVGGLKLTPVAPTMIEARDALLATILANGANEDFALFTAAFAKRGLGGGAYIPDRYSASMEGTTESRTTGSDIEVRSTTLGLATGCDADGTLDAGETARLTLVVANSGFAPLSGATVRVTAASSAVTFPEGDTVVVGDIPLFGTKTVSLPVTLGAGAATAGAITFFATPNAPGIQSPPGYIGSTTIIANFDEAARTGTSEDFTGTAPGWQFVREPAGTGPGGWLVKGENATRFLHGDDTAAVAINWAQTPAMAVGAGPLTVTLTHRWDFEHDDDEDVYYDGGLVQVSSDGGATWTDVQIPNSQVLSDCCGNPAAGRRAFAAKNVEYPSFRQTTLTLGTAYANQSDVRLRFGVATDEATTASGWDIDRIAVAGLADTPFATPVAQPASCAAASYKTLQGAMSGTYFSPARSGEGVLVDFGQIGATPVVFFSWYTYEGGRQQWMVGSAPFSTSATSVALDLIETSGANFGSQFRTQDVRNTPWGTATLSFPDCDTLLLTYRSAAGESGTLSMQRGLARLEQGQCSVLHGGLSGTYYSTSRSGEGVLVDFGKAGNDPVEFFTWYTYDGGRQQWLVGSKRFAAADPTVSVDVISTSGAQFGNGFRSQDVTNTPWGTVTQRFVDCDTLELSYQKTGGETGTLTLQRGLQRLGDGVCR